MRKGKMVYIEQVLGEPVSSVSCAQLTVGSKVQLGSKYHGEDQEEPMASLCFGCRGPCATR